MGSQIKLDNKYMGETYFQNSGPGFLTCPQLVGTWVQHIFRNVAPYVLTCPQLVGTRVQYIFRNYTLLSFPSVIRADEESENVSDFLFRGL